MTIPHLPHGRIWRINNVRELLEFERQNPNFPLPVTIRTRYINHLETDYSKASGAKRLGYTPIKPQLLISNTHSHRKAYADTIVVCKEGNLSREEAAGIGDCAFIPTPDEIKAAAARIRAKHEAAGVIRNAETVGFDLDRTICYRELAYSL